MKNHFWYVCSIAFVLLFSAHNVVFAVSSTFPIRAFVGDDTEAPTVPVLQSVVPVSPLQINISWSAATDNVYLVGYRLFRDGIQIATTSQTVFTDTGLTPETLYEYTVDAFDSYSNYSSTSVPVATSTLAMPVVPPVATTSTSTPTRPTAGVLTTRLDSFEVTPNQRSAFFNWKTNTNTRYTIQWGRTASYELGSVSTNIYNQAHVTTIENLEPGTRYWYVISSTDGRGLTQVTKQGDFMTLPVVQATLPLNVRNVTATVVGESVVLHWQNPPLQPRAIIRVIRSYFFYPLSPTDGALVYEGRGTDVVDSTALASHSPQYYTIFVIDENGSVSSGAVVQVSRQGSTSVGTATTSVHTPTIPSVETGEETVLKAAAVFIRQGVKTQNFSEPLELDFDQTAVIYIPVDAVTTHLKSIIVTIQDPTDQRLSTSYLLKLNQVGDAYEAVIEPPHVQGNSRAIVEVFDFHQASVRRIITPLVFVAPDTVPVVFPDDVLRYGNQAAPFILGGGIFFGVLWLLLLFVRRRREDKP